LEMAELRSLAGNWQLESSLPRREVLLGSWELEVGS